MQPLVLVSYHSTGSCEPLANIADTTVAKHESDISSRMLPQPASSSLPMPTQAIPQPSLYLQLCDCCCRRFTGCTSVQLLLLFYLPAAAFFSASSFAPMLSFGLTEISFVISRGRCASCGCAVPL